MKCISDIGLAIYGLYGQLIVDICVVMALRTFSDTKSASKSQSSINVYFKVISQLGFCIAYCVFVAENIQADEYLAVHIQLCIQECTTVFSLVTLVYYLQLLQGHYL